MSKDHDRKKKLALMKESPIFIRSAYNYDMDAASDATGLSCPEPSKAQQEFKEESDINFIAERYGLTGEMPEVKDRPMYGDFTGIFNYQDAQNQIVQANQAFMELPAKLRARFHNNPAELLAFLDDPENRKEAEAIGLVKPPEKPATIVQAEPKVDGTGATPAPDPKALGDAPKPPKN